MEQCLSLMDVIWTWEGRREALGESLRSEMLPLGACLYPLVRAVHSEKWFWWYHGIVYCIL